MMPNDDLLRGLTEPILPMVHGLAEQSGGRLTMASEKNVGTTMAIWLPVIEGEFRDEPVRETAPEIAESGRQRLRVLAVDDDALVLMNTAAMLEDEGHTVVEAVSGEDALNVLRGPEKIDLVITDQAMPRMTGLELAKTIRAKWPKLPIIMATGYAELPEGAGSDLIRLSKPFTQAQLAEAMNASPSSGVFQRVTRLFQSN